MKSGVFCTYYLKTLMLWETEEQPPEFWLNDDPADLIVQILEKMIDMLKSKSCRNYFIPENNMIDNVPNDELEKLVQDLQRVVRDVEYASSLLGKQPQGNIITNQVKDENIINQIIQSCKFEESLAINTIVILNTPTWIKRALLIFTSIHHPLDYSSDVFQREVLNALSSELSDIYIGILQQKKASTCDDDSLRKFLQCSKTHLKKASGQFKSPERDTHWNCNRIMAFTWLDHFFELMGEKVRNETSIGEVEEEEKQVSIIFRRTVNDSTETMLFKPRSDSFSPTVNLSWFVAKAHLANLYYLSYQDCAAAIDTCEEIMETLNDSSRNKLFAEGCIPLIISTHWASVYDKELQQVLGFQALCSYIMIYDNRAYNPSTGDNTEIDNAENDNKANDGVHLGVCPILFALYVKSRATRDQGVLAKSTETNNCSKEFWEHFEKCECDEKVNNGRESLCCAINLVGRDVESKQR